MSETRDNETFKMRAGIMELIAGIALSGVEGVSGIAMRPEHPEDLKKRKNLSKGIKVEVEEDRAAVDIDVNMEYGRDFIASARKVQEAVTEIVESMTGRDVVAVNVNVVGVSAL
jgi:uncharacterized alkaline shock family protein YloU